MKSLKTFEPPKNGENILEDTKSFEKTVLWIMTICFVSLSVLFYKISIIPFVFGNTRLVIFFVIFFLTISVIGEITINKKNKIGRVFYFDDYLKIEFNNNVPFEKLQSIPFSYWDKFIHLREGYLLIIVPLNKPSILEIQENEKSSYIPIYGELGIGYKQKMKVSNRYNNVTTELVNFLNTKIKGVIVEKEEDVNWV